MRFINKNVSRSLLVILIVLLLITARSLFFSHDIDYNVDVKPILNKHCISCHGGVKKSGGFSLMTRDDALQKNDSGKEAILPGNPSESEMIKRIKSNDPDERMPLEGPPLSDEEISILENWIDQGAEWGLHWAYQPIENPKRKVSSFSLFHDKEKENPSKSIDDYVVKKLEERGLTMQGQAKKSELLRRLSLDIIGIPSPMKLQEEFLSGKMDYATLVDSLLAQQSYGEKWASMWLDMARYADSKGFEKDAARTIWPYRDYVIRALNEDKPYTQFVIEQLAGDMLDNPTEEQYIATGFHRNTMTNDEGGTNNEEFRVKAVMDRVATTWEGLMGTTMACVQCHGHPYDPFKHEDYYRSYAIFNNTRDADTHMDYPRYKIMDDELKGQLDSLNGMYRGHIAEDKIDEIIRFIKTGQPVIYSIEADRLTNAALYDTKYLGLRNNGYARLEKVNLTGKDKLVIRIQNLSRKGVFSLHLDSLNGNKIGSVFLKNAKTLYGFMEVPLQLTNGIHDIYLKYVGPASMADGQVGIQFDWFYFTKKLPDNVEAKHKDLFYNSLRPRQNHSLIMVENPDNQKRETYLFDRGNWQAKTKRVFPGVPSVLQQEDHEMPMDRLAFARWVVSKDNPLTARTFVNRVWEQLFGQGIVLTTEDLGSQGAKPSHRELLNFLAYQWMHEQDWSIKKLIKTIVLSKTYRQSAHITAVALEKDPYNRLLSRGPRVRLSAEQIRDQALAISGLLSDKMYGPPVMPYQPKGIWQTPYNNQQWVNSKGEDSHRRSVYTFIKRSSVYPSMEIFDGAQRQLCTSRRIRTNTPLQALVTMNDSVFVEASIKLAERMKNEGGEDVGSQIDFAYQLAMARPISIDKKRILEDLYHNTKTQLADTQSGEKDVMALATVANAIINLDELLNK